MVLAFGNKANLTAGNQCEARIVVMQDPINLIVVITRVSGEHTHKSAMLDQIKRNDGLRLKAVAQAPAPPATILAVLQGFGKFGNGVEQLNDAGGQFLTREDIKNWLLRYQTGNPDLRIVDNKLDWIEQLAKAHAFLTGAGYLCESLQVREKGDEYYGVVFAKPHRIEALRRFGALTIMDSTHKTNALGWKLFSLMVRLETGLFIPTAHFLVSNEKSVIIAEAMRSIRRFAFVSPDLCWRPRWILTDDSAAERLAVKLTWPVQNSAYTAVGNETVSNRQAAADSAPEHFLCRVHSQRTLYRKIHDTEVRKHIMHALYHDKTEAECKNSLEKALKRAIALEKHKNPHYLPHSEREKLQHQGLDITSSQSVEKTDPVTYLTTRWLNTHKLWANYARRTSCLLLQVTTTNSVEQWHASLKKPSHSTAAQRAIFSLEGICHLVDLIAGQWDSRATKANTNFKKKNLSETFRYPELKLFPLPIQKLLVSQLQEARRRISDNKQVYINMDHTICRCVWFAKYQLPCSHIWQQHLLNDTLKSTDWDAYSMLFKSNGLEIYESLYGDIRRTEAEKRTQVQDDTTATYSRNTLRVQEQVYQLQNKWFELAEQLSSSSISTEARLLTQERWLLHLDVVLRPLINTTAAELLSHVDPERSVAFAYEKHALDTQAYELTMRHTANQATVLQEEDGEDMDELQNEEDSNYDDVDIDNLVEAWEET
jgi:hypothetical protein